MNEKLTDYLSMSKYYRDYFWKDGIPYGLDPLSDPSATSYKIPMDPYRKKISIEKYEWGDFFTQVYNSELLDFRSLKVENQLAWERTALPKSEGPKSLIRDQNDRVILIEEYVFRKTRCIECRILTPHKVLIAVQNIYYKEFNEAFDGVILRDANNHQVMSKEYAMNSQTNEFGDLLKENWDMQRALK